MMLVYLCSRHIPSFLRHTIWHLFKAIAFSLTRRFISLYCAFVHRSKNQPEPTSTAAINAAKSCESLARSSLHPVTFNRHAFLRNLHTLVGMDKCPAPCLQPQRCSHKTHFEIGVMRGRISFIESKRAYPNTPVESRDLDGSYDPLASLISDSLCRSSGVLLNSCSAAVKGIKNNHLPPTRQLLEEEYGVPVVDRTN